MIYPRQEVKSVAGAVFQYGWIGLLVASNEKIVHVLSSPGAIEKMRLKVWLSNLKTERDGQTFARRLKVQTQPATNSSSMDSVMNFDGLFVPLVNFMQQ